MDCSPTSITPQILFLNSSSVFFLFHNFKIIKKRKFQDTQRRRLILPLIFVFWKLAFISRTERLKKTKIRKRRIMSQNLKKLTVKNINNWKLKILKKNFKFNSLFSPNNYNNYEKKMMCIIDLAWESLSKKSRSQLKFFFVSKFACAIFDDWEKKIPSYWNKCV